MVDSQAGSDKTSGKVPGAFNTENIPRVPVTELGEKFATPPEQIAKDFEQNAYDAENPEDQASYFRQAARAYQDLSEAETNMTKKGDYLERANYLLQKAAAFKEPKRQ